MAQHDYIIANQSGASFRADLNNALAAVVSQNSGAAGPSTTYAYMTWADTATGLFKLRNGANSAWIELFELDGEFGNKVFNGNITLNAQGDLRFADADSSNWVAFQAPSTVASNVTWTLPSADGVNGQSLTTNGSGTLSWGGNIASRSEVDGVHTTGTITSGTASLTVASATGIVAGMVVTGQGITPGTTVSSISGTTVTLSANAGATLSSKPVAFYDNVKAVSPGSVGGQLCRAWVNFDGTGTVAIRASFNVSSITDNGVGDYTINFTTAMPDANYAFCTGNNNYNAAFARTVGTFSNSPTANSLRLVQAYTSASYTQVNEDTSLFTVAIFR